MTIESSQRIRSIVDHLKGSVCFFKQALPFLKKYLYNKNE